MGIIRPLRRFAVLSALMFVATFAAVIWQTARFENPPFDTLMPVDTIVCLGAGMDPDGTLHPTTIARVETCAALYAAGAAQSVHFTGGRAVEGGPSAGAQMALRAERLGVPVAVITVEEASLSTLQNALFSQPMLTDARSIRIVTEAFHLPRARASFALMGDHQISTTMSEPVRLMPDGGWNWRILLRETVAVWFNAARVLLWYGAATIGMEGRDALLA